MKKTLFVSITLLLVLGLASCNVFDWMEPTTDHFDRCKGLNDKGDYEAAVAECEKADPDGVDLEVQLELADASLGTLGVSISFLSDVFLEAAEGTDTILALAESLIGAGYLNWENHADKIEYAVKAVEAIDRYGTLLKSNAEYCRATYYVENPTTECAQIAAFYSTLARVCLVSATMAYADIGPNGNHNGKITKAEVCNPANAACATSTCIGVTCEGMDSDDAGIAGEALALLVADLSSLDLPGLQEAVDEMVDIDIWVPGEGFKKIWDAAAEPYQADGGRNIIYTMARD